MLTPEELRQIRRVSIQAGRRVNSLFAGGYRSAFKGRGMEFEEVRPYVPGDDVRHLDWNVTARSQTPHVKEFREERELTLVLAVDVSGSMAFGDGGRDGRTDKRLQQARVAGALAYAATRNNDRVGLMAFTDTVERYVPPRKSRSHAWRVIRAIFEHRPTRPGTDLSGSLEYLGRVLRRRATVCVISDFIGDPGHERALAALASKHRVHALLVHDPLEERVPDVGLIELVDAESGQRRLVDTRTLARPRPVKERLGALRRTGAFASAIGTGDDPFHVLEMHFQRVGAMR
ncbi:MAG: DUF58 domain-containing protein [Alphaproteobacteria bacterium]|nr:DUF58 domain-containing protein [Alphaproteobacteria bacterium]